MPSALNSFFIHPQNPLYNCFVIMRPLSKSISQSDRDGRNLTQEQALPKDGPKQAVFLDRDGTINVEKGYITNPQEIALVPMAGESISILNRQKIPVIVI